MGKEALMLKKLLIFAAVILGYFGLFLFFTSVHHQMGMNQPKADRGVLDLTNWDFEQNGSVWLNGEWAFYRDRLLIPEAIEANKEATPSFIRVPNNTLNPLNEQIPNADVGTYRLIVRSDQDRMFGLKTSYIYYSNKIYVNGQLVGSSGRPGNQETFEPGNAPYVAYFPIHRGDNELIVQFANYGPIGGSGIGKPILFGTQHAISRAHYLSLMNETIMIASLLFIGLYFFGHYLQNRKRTWLLPFSMVSTQLAIAISCIGQEHLILQLIPDFPYPLFWLTMGISNLCSLIMMLLYLNAAFKPYVSRTLISGLIVLAVLTFLTSFLPSAYVFAYLLTSFDAVVTWAYATYVLILAVTDRAEGSTYIAFAAASMSVYIVMTTVHSYSSQLVFPFYSITLILGLMALALLASKRFALTYRKIENLSQRLLEVGKLKDAFIARTSHEFRTPLNGIINISRTLLKNRGGSGTESVDRVKGKTMDESPAKNKGENEKDGDERTNDVRSGTEGNEDINKRTEGNDGVNRNEWGPSGGSDFEKIRLIRHMCYHLSDLVNDILDLEKIKRGMLSVEPGPVHIRSLVDLEVEFFRPAAEKKGLRIEKLVPADLPPVQADNNRLRQIVSNLLDNAIKYTYKGQVTISARQLARHMKITVADTGTGIPEDARQKIFGVYEQADVHAREGVGLGLSIVQQLVKLQGGRIWLESVVGKGSAFHFTLPIAGRPSPEQRAEGMNSNKIFTADKASAAAKDESNDPGDLRGTRGRTDLFYTASSAAGRADKEPSEIPARRGSSQRSSAPSYFPKDTEAPTVLIVAHDRDHVKILIDMLAGISCHAIAAQSGEGALDSLKKATPDLVIIEFMMPDITGLELCRRIRKQYRLVDLPVLMLTDSVIDADKYQAFRAGANDVLQKPYRYSEFVSRVRGLILMKRASTEAANMEVAFLQSQIKPHFLYNVLNSIMALSYDDPVRAREMTAHFANYLRASFDFRNTSEMTKLSNELSLVHSFLAIEKIRFGDRLNVVEDIDPDLDFPVPPLIIQPLIENAVHYGIGRKRAGGTIRLTVHETGGDRCLIRVSDSGPGIPPDRIKDILSMDKEDGRSIGLKNINHRLQHFYETTLSIESTVGKGTAVSFEIRHQ